MRKLIRSMAGFSWAASLFGLRQATRGIASGGESLSHDLAGVTAAAAAELDSPVRDLFQAGVNLQNGIVDAMLAPLNGSKPATGSAPNASPAPAPQPESGRLRTSTFIVLGEGLAAGMGDFTLSSEFQERSFPALMARQMGTAFAQPLFQPPGIGEAIGFAPWTVVVPSPLQSTVIGQIPPEPPCNLSVPGFTVSDAVSLRPRQPLIDRACAKQTAANLILGIRDMAYGAAEPLPTQLESAIRRHPTLALVELGYAEALEAAVHGTPDRLPPPDAFYADYLKIVKGLRSAGADVVCLTIPDPISTAHFSSIPTAAATVKLDPQAVLDLWNLLPDDLITANGLNEISFQVYAASIGATTRQSFSPLAPGSTLQASVASDIQNRVQSLNARIQRIAAAEGAVVFDLYDFFRRVHDSGVAAGTRILKGSYLGGFYSLNGYYPGATGNALIANQILELLNREFSAAFPALDVAAVAASDPVAGYRGAAGPNWSREALTSPSPLPVPGSPPASGPPAPPDAEGPILGGADYILQLPPGLQQVLPLVPEVSYFGDAISAQNCLTPQTIQWASGNNLLFGGLAMMDSHLRGRVRLRFSPPVDDWTTFEISLEGGLAGSDSVIAAPRFFKMPGRQQLIGDVPGHVSSGRLNLRTGQVDSVRFYFNFFNSALFALVQVNPNFPKTPLSFPGQYGSASVTFEQRPDGNLDFTFYGSTFVPLGNGTSFPLNFGGPSRQFASIPANGTAIHPHISLTTKEPVPVNLNAEKPEIPANAVREFTLFTPVSSFGDAFTLHAPQLGGPALGRSRLLGRVQIQFGWPAENSVPIAVSLASAGGSLAPLASTPLAQLFPGTLTPGPGGFNANLRFPLRTYSLNDLSVLDDPFDVSVGAIDLRTGRLLQPLLHRGFINQDLLFALLRVEPRTPKDSFFFRGDGSYQKNPSKGHVFQYFGQVHIPYPPGFAFPYPNLATGFPVVGGGSLDPYLWMWAFQDDEPPEVEQKGSADRILSTRGEIISYRFAIGGSPRKHAAQFEYANHTQDGKFHMHSLVWVGWGNSNTGAREPDTLTFCGFGTWSKAGVERVAQASVQVSMSPAAPWIGIQIAQAEISDAETPLPPSAFPVPVKATPA